MGQKIRYNLYRIEKPKENDLVAKLKKQGLVKGEQRNVDGFNLTMYYSREPADTDVWWAKVYGDFIGEAGAGIKNKLHFAVFVVSNQHVCYAASMGKSHFYLQEFCDADFGINLAERIVSGGVRMKSARLFGGRKSKAITMFHRDATTDFETGESVNFLKARTIDKAKWGDGVSFGTSVQFSLEITPQQLPGLVRQIEEEMGKPKIVEIPRATLVSEKGLVQSLDKKLAAAVLQDVDAAVQSAEAVVSGVEFIFSDQSQYRFRVPGTNAAMTVEELTLGNLRQFVNDNNIDLNSRINDMKVQAWSEQRSKFTKPLKYFLDFVDEENCFLQDGRWHRLNEDYLNRLREQIDSVKVEECTDVAYSHAEFREWKTRLSDDQRKVSYPEFFFNQKAAEELGYVVLDRQMTGICGKFKLELADLYKDGTVFHVKFGPAQKLAYVFDQSLATIRAFRHRLAPLVVDDVAVVPKRFGVWFVMDRVAKVARPSDVRSLIFWMKLADWRRECRDAEFEPLVRVSYKAS